MKNNLRLNTLSLLVASGMLLGSAACTRTESETAADATTSVVSTEAETAYTNYRTFVEEATADTMMVPYQVDRDWNREVESREVAYKERQNEIDKYARTYDESRKTEIEDLKTKYNNYWDARRNEYMGYSYRTEMRMQLLGLESSDPELASLTPTNIRLAYETFVKQVEENKEDYTNQDWEIVDMTWTSLDARKNMIQDQLSAKDKLEIGKAKTKYQAMKAASKTENTMEEGGSKLKSGVKSAGSAVGSGAEKAGSAVKSGAKAVGKGAKKVGSETKETYKDVKD
ncbi:MAG TPA: DUF6565 domain-containing protein [Adhaeribacter sp.]|nr:DUF6565 domain-containing protein [Adhaeribacter sp.]